MPSLEELNKSFTGKDFVILGIDIQEDKERVLSKVRQYGLSYENLLDEDGDVSNLYGVRSTPSKIIIDSKGNIVGAALGYREWDDEQVKLLIRKLIDAG